MEKSIKEWTANALVQVMDASDGKAQERVALAAALLIHELVRAQESGAVKDDCLGPLMRTTFDTIEDGVYEALAGCGEN